MTRSSAELFGFVPSLEVLPFFGHPFQAAGEGSAPALRFVAHSSYGGIARDLLTGGLMGGILPWEIFTTDVLALPGQRTRWRVPLFLDPCPTELVVRESIHRLLYPAKRGVKTKPPARLVFGVESRNSLTKNQVAAWVASKLGGPPPEIAFKMLPMDLMVQGLQAEVLDGFIAPAPWGLLAEREGLGKLDMDFTAGAFAQQVVLVCGREGPPPEFLAETLKVSRAGLKEAAPFKKASKEMARAGKPSVKLELLEEAARVHGSLEMTKDTRPDLKGIVGALRHLESCGTLPPQIAANEQTARLLLD